MCMTLPCAFYSIFRIDLSITNYRGYKIADQDDLKVPLITNSGNKVMDKKVVCVPFIII